MMLNHVVCRNTVSPVIKGASKNPEKAAAEDTDEAEVLPQKSNGQRHFQQENS